MTYVQKVASHIGVLNNKELVFSGTIQSFTENSRQFVDEALWNLIGPQKEDISEIQWLNKE